MPIPSALTPPLVALLAASAVAIQSHGHSHRQAERQALPKPETEPGESRFLTNPVQLTFADDFVKAGESYFSPDGNRVIFQAVSVDTDTIDSDIYGMYLADFVDGQIQDPIEISRPGTANTCGWFHPKTSNKIIFGSTIDGPGNANPPGYQRGSGRYRWAFPSEMEVVVYGLPFAVKPDEGGSPYGYWGNGDVWSTKVFEKPGYTAECSYSPDGRYILYANVDEAKSNEVGRPDADLWVFDTETEKHTLIVEAEGYDGGPFFSPDGTWICYRSDRRGDNLLQLFVAELSYDDSGAITGIAREIQLTDNQHVNWAPFFHPSGDFLVYASSAVSHRNYEVFAIGFDPEDPRPTKPVRLTFAEGFDGLPVFDSDGDRMMWTAQRGDDTRWGGRASSQLWIADFDADAVRKALAEANAE